MSEYKRLTERDEYGNADIIGLSTEKLFGELYFDEINLLTNALNKLAFLEDKIENGTLVELPCKVGDTVYIATKLWDIKEVVEAEVACIEVTADEKGIRYITYLDHEYVFSKTNPNLVANRYIFYNDEFFLTKAEAEKKLKELQEDKK